MQDTVRQNLLRIQEDIAPYKPNIIAVTKYFDESAIIEAYNAGLRDFGESRAVEAVERINNLPADVRDNSTFHFIGHLQTNKVRKVLTTFDYIHSVDSLKLAEVISKDAKEIGKVQNILLQLNNANEVQKFGFSKEELLEEFPKIKVLPNINVAGIMNMAPVDADVEELDRLFADVADFKKTLEEKYNCSLKELSMGMSRDYKEAVRNGATMIRIGRKLFIK